MVPINLILSASSAVAGQPVTLTATELTLFLFPGASMTFFDNGVAIPGSTTALDQNGVASFTTTLAVGSHGIVAVLNSCCNSSNAASVTILPTSVPALSQPILALVAVLLMMIGCLRLTGSTAKRSATVRNPDSEL